MAKEKGNGAVAVKAETGKVIAVWSSNPAQPEGKSSSQTEKQNQDQPGRAQEREQGCRIVIPVRQDEGKLAADIVEYLLDKPLGLAALLAGNACPPEVEYLLPAELPLEGMSLTAGPAGSAEPAGKNGVRIDGSANLANLAESLNSLDSPDSPDSPGIVNAESPTASAGSAKIFRVGGLAPTGLRCACGRMDCPRAPELLRAAQARWAADPQLRLTALGLAPEELARAVFAAWAADGADVDVVDDADAASVGGVGANGETAGKGAGAANGGAAGSGDASSGASSSGGPSGGTTSGSGAAGSEGPNSGTANGSAVGRASSAPGSAGSGRPSGGAPGGQPGASEEAAPKRPHTGPAIAEWLASAAARNRLHTPGPELLEWRKIAPNGAVSNGGGVGPNDPAPSGLGPDGSAPGSNAPGSNAPSARGPVSGSTAPEAASPRVKAALAELLPGVPGAPAGLERIAQRAAELARKQLASARPHREERRQPSDR